MNKRNGLYGDGGNNRPKDHSKANERLKKYDMMVIDITFDRFMDEYGWRGTWQPVTDVFNPYQHGKDRKIKFFYVEDYASDGGVGIYSKGHLIAFTEYRNPPKVKPDEKKTEIVIKTEDRDGDPHREPVDTWTFTKKIKTGLWDPKIEDEDEARDILTPLVEKLKENELSHVLILGNFSCKGDEEKVKFDGQTTYSKSTRQNHNIPSNIRNYRDYMARRGFYVQKLLIQMGVSPKQVSYGYGSPMIGEAGMSCSFVVTIVH